jgi:hypothetical protein
MELMGQAFGPYLTRVFRLLGLDKVFAFWLIEAKAKYRDLSTALLTKA